jgi:hypothetical protein
MADYITTAELGRFLLGASAADATKLSFAVTSASRIFDRLCNVADNYFAPAGVSASDKVINGSGTTILPLPPFIGTLGTVTYEDGTTSEEIVDSDYYKLKGEFPHQVLESVPFSSYDAFRLYLYDRYYAGESWKYRYLWRLDKNYTVSARWGFTAVPDDVKSAVIQLAITLMSDLDTAKTERLESKTHVADHLPANSIAALAVKKYKSTASLGI